MSLQVSFRVVGLYCYFENLQLSNVSPQSTVQEVMNAVQGAESAFSYKSVDMGGKEIVDTMSYDFTSNSRTPYNSSGTPAQGSRDLSNKMGDTSLVWQYYRSVTGSIDGSVCEIKLLSQGQPSFATTPLDYNDSFFGSLPANFQISTYNLTWRLVEIQMSPEKQAAFMLAKANAIKSYK
ncbi:hypothetical protein ACFO3O_01665 [Dokdonia ponticola]|uniref:Uncharacterized protein n=1 Tax=Dokdonia ponticola TaxID=2041041 RepID=A0ABV9HRW6_9FLAO